MKNIIEKDYGVNTKEIMKLRKEFPSCFDKEGKFNIQKFTKLIEGDFEVSNDSYSLNWLGKSYSRLLVNTPVTTLLTEDKTHNSLPENTKSNNLYIEGDNLEVLKHLTNAYHEKIKMIYIDPPYNTGSDFIYQDDRKFTPEELSKLANVDKDEAKKILEFTSSKSNSHSAWLTFMYPRLYIARELLKDEGVIFISIDDNEQAQLKLLCDEIFGEDNFGAHFIWEKKYSPSNDSKDPSAVHDHILMYKKNRTFFKMGLGKRTEEMNARYKNYDNDPRGVWKPGGMSAKTYNEKYDYEITTPSGKVVSPPSGSCWQYSEEKFLEEIQKNNIYFGKNNDSKPQIKQFLSNVQNGVVPKTILKKELVGHGQISRKEVTDLMGEFVFDNPKPTLLISKLIEVANLEENDTVLDFFSGSSTTAHSVMQINAEENSRIKYIMIQLPEDIDSKSSKSAYDFCIDNKLVPVIPSIAKERIRRAADKIRNENKDKMYIDNIDFGFKVYKTTELDNSNYLDELEKLNPAEISLFPEEKLTIDELNSLALTWKTHDGIELSKEFNVVIIEGYETLVVDNRMYLMHKDFNIERFKAFLNMNDNDPNFTINHIVMYGINFSSKNIMEIKEGINIQNKKSVNIELEVRY